MKTGPKILNKVFAALGFLSTLLTQTSANAYSGVTIPITIVLNDNMYFRNIPVSATLPATITLSPTGSVNCKGGCHQAKAANEKVEAASFTVTGQGGFCFSITLPDSGVITDGAGHAMIVDAFVSSPSVTGVLSDPGGIQKIIVGATLNIGAGQSPGFYSNATSVPITVNYN